MGVLLSVLEVLTVIFLILTVLTACLSNNSKFRYYSLWLWIGVYSIFLSFALLPIFLFRLRDRKNLKLWALPIRLGRKFLGFEHVVLGEEKLGKTPCVIVGNHQTMLDAALNLEISELCGDLLTTSKRETMYMGHFGLLIWLSGGAFIKKNVSTVEFIVELMKENFKKGERPTLHFFPEGTRGNGDELLPFKTGAFVVAIQLQMPIVPLVRPRMSHLVDHKRKTFKRGTVYASVLDPIPTEGLTLEDVEPLKEKVRGLIDAEMRRLDTFYQNSKDN